MQCPSCRNPITPGVEFCPVCLAQVGPPRPSEPLLAEPVPAGAAASLGAEVPLPAQQAANAEPSGLGGWLILPAISLCISPLIILWQVVTMHLAVFTDGRWEALTTEGSAAYHPMWGPLLIYELLLNSGTVIFTVVAAVFFFTRRAAAPKLMIALYLARVVLMVGDQLLTASIPAVEKAEGMPEALRAAFQACVWIPYFLVSKRVKNTFVR